MVRCSNCFNPDPVTTCDRILEVFLRRITVGRMLDSVCRKRDAAAPYWARPSELEGRVVKEMFRLRDTLDLYLVRHPKPAVDPGLCYGVTDLDVAEDPVVCAARLRPVLPEGARVISSPLRRARLLADALHPAVELDERLRELDFGDWEMKPFREIPSHGFDAWSHALVDFRAPAGELFADMAARVWAAFEAHRRDTAALVIVGHNGPMRALTGSLLGLPPERWLNLEFDFGCMTHLAIGPLGAKLRGFNR